MASLAFEGEPPQAADLSRRWHDALDMAGRIVERLPADKVGQAVVAADRRLFAAGPPELDRAVAAGAIMFHKGRIGGAWPQVKG